MTEKLTVDADGKIVIPPEVIQKRGLHPAMSSHSSSLLKVCSFTMAASMKIFRRGGTDSTKGSACSHKMMLYARRI